MPYYKPLNSEIGDGLGQTSLEKLMEDQRLTEKVRRGVPVSFNNNRLKAEGVERRLYAIEAEIKTALMQGKKVSVDCCDRQIKITIS